MGDNNFIPRLNYVLLYYGPYPRPVRAHEGNYTKIILNRIQSNKAGYEEPTPCWSKKTLLNRYLFPTTSPLPRTFTTCVYLSHALTTVNAPNIQALPIWGLRGSHSDGMVRTDRQSMQWGVQMYILAEEQQREHT